MGGEGRILGRPEVEPGSNATVSRAQALDMERRGLAVARRVRSARSAPAGVSDGATSSRNGPLRASPGGEASGQIPRPGTSTRRRR